MSAHNAITPSALAPTPPVQHDAGGAVVAAPAPGACPIRKSWLRRLGFAGFMFFLIKGLLWLIVPAAIALWRGWTI